MDNNRCTQLCSHSLQAAVVSQMRQEIANLKLDLSRLVEAGGLTGDKECDSKVQKLLQGVRLLMDEQDWACLPCWAELTWLWCTQVVRPDSVPATAFTESGESWAVALDPDLQAEVALLEVENERLREEAQVLLMRQQLLEDLAAKVGVRWVRADLVLGFNVHGMCSSFMVSFLGRGLMLPVAAACLLLLYPCDQTATNTDAAPCFMCADRHRKALQLTVAIIDATT